MKIDFHTRENKISRKGNIFNKLIFSQSPISQDDDLLSLLWGLLYFY